MSPERAAHFVTPFQGFVRCHPVTQGVAVGWLVSGPLALRQLVGMRRITPLLEPTFKSHSLREALRPNQRDQDTLPPYEILDPILEFLIEDGLSPEEITARGFDEATVLWVVKRVAQNEYKRAQSVPGLKVTSKAFGVGRRMPVAQRFAE